MLNRDIYAKEPAKNRIANNGVAELSEDLSTGAQNVLRYELQTFVCNGQYERGLERILGSFLSNLDGGSEQPGVWISGFYGSGKSQPERVLVAVPIAGCHSAYFAHQDRCELEN